MEIELKFEIGKSDIRNLTKRLVDAGFVSGKRCFEKTTMYDNPTRLMGKTNGRVRLRKIGNSDYEFSYKKPAIGKGKIKKEIEHEVVVPKGKPLEKILEAMEFTPVSSYERFRRTLMMGRLKVTLDEFPFATFIEIEGATKEITRLAKELGFDLKMNLMEPCDTIFTKWRHERGLNSIPHLTFKTYAN